MLKRILFGAAGLWALNFAGSALAANPSTFAQPKGQKPKVVRVLALEGVFDPRSFEAFERATGYEVAYDAYALALEVPEKWKEGPYDLVALPGPALAKRIAAGALARLDRRRIADAHLIEPSIDAKLAAYDPGDAYSIPIGWAPYGLVFNVKKVEARLGAAPTSWSALLDPRYSHLLADCGVATPNARDAMFVAAWRMMGIDPAHLRPLEIRSAAVLMARAKSAMHSFALADSIGALARGSICLTIGTPGEAAAANTRARTMGVTQGIGFAEPKEGGGVEIEALAVPRDAPNADIAYKLIDYLLSPEAASENAHASGLAPATTASDAELMKHLWPLGAFDDSFAAAMETEWTRLRTSK